MDPMSAMALASVASQQLGRLGSLIAGRPKKRQRLPIEELMARGQQDVLQGANRAQANLGTTLAPALAARGLQRSAIGPSLLSRSYGEMVGGGLAELARKRGELELMQREREEEDRQARRRWLVNLFTGAGESVGQGLSDVGTYYEQEAQIRALEERLRELRGGYGGGHGAATFPRYPVGRAPHGVPPRGMPGMPMNLPPFRG